jgi:hypothetical protein
MKPRFLQDAIYLDIHDGEVGGYAHNCCRGTIFFSNREMNIFVILSSNIRETQLDIGKMIGSSNSNGFIIQKWSCLMDCQTGTGGIQYMATFSIPRFGKYYNAYVYG